ncbi:endo-1,4-beta-xylanase [Roseiconus lacunae]|uniref:Endo-1,4-beta-xylanase n=1 Tax=Roseiconus lacunae TaxID=2605694 RepID=A0ABT7PHP8_9BACT|nr:endo-1,4-beta-xylanase [Roseiconus lacunae]MCD0461189.1 endo-1,4-beta-xylanase [Roseiconus lacunae]MDM4016015.1 endo-1,4-beta-xylanase [Roseiconus lacunae]WRQ51653.1 endo-1,4-beta-xylanase [Stieleria sp. HD01]
MGQFHFAVPPDSTLLLKQTLWKDAYICGIEGVPWECKLSKDDGVLTIKRPVETSGKLYLTCPTKGLGYRTLSTCTLMPGEQRYPLFLELARGSCYRARVQSDAWQRAGLSLSDRFGELLQRGTEQFLDAATLRDDLSACSKAALQAIATLENAIADLGESFALQSIAFRKQREPQLGTLLAGSVVPPSPTRSQHSSRFNKAFNTAAVRLNWSLIEEEAGRFDFEKCDRTIQWCGERGMKVLCGPLLDFRSEMMPAWFYLIEDNFESFLSSITQYTERVVNRYRGSVHLWNCATGLNTPGPIPLDDEQVMRLAVAILQTVRRVDPNTPAIISFDQPFGEYLAKHRDGISALHFADAIARSGLGMAGIGLDIRLNYAADATLPRSALDFGQMIDRWATLGIPMLVQMTIPGDCGNDAQARVNRPTLINGDNKAELAANQLRTAGPLVRTLLAKHMVHGIVWDGWADDEPHVQAHSGVIDAAGDPRPVLDYFERLREELLT